MRMPASSRHGTRSIVISTVRLLALLLHSHLLWLLLVVHLRVFVMQSLHQ